MEDVRKRIKYDLVNDEQILQTRIADPLFMDRDIISDDLVGIHIFKPRVILNKPIYIGQAVLDNSKLEMYELYYYTLKPCPLVHDMRILGGDTDSFFLQLRTGTHVLLDDFYKYFKDYLDSSNYKKEHPLFTEANRAKLGCFKDETAGRLISEILCLRPKMYSMLFADQDASTIKQIKRAKGIAKALVKTFRHQNYQDAFHNKIECYVEMTCLRSKTHTLSTHKTRKRGLSAWDDKRCWLSENESLPYGSSLSSVTWECPAKQRKKDVPASGDIQEDVSLLDDGTPHNTSNPLHCRYNKLLVRPMTCARHNIRVVNALWQTRIPFTFECPSTEAYFSWLNQLIDGATLLCKQSSETKVFLARPCMLKWKWNCHHVQRCVTILFFPNRTIQFLGALTDNTIYQLYLHCVSLVRRRDLPFPRLKTMTIVYPLHGRIANFHTLFHTSNTHCVYETDIFPGAQLTYWSPLHVILFHTGTVTISGVKSFCQVGAIIHDLLTNKYFSLFTK